MEKDWVEERNQNVEGCDEEVWCERESEGIKDPSLALLHLQDKM